jgi:hypothetical protein
MAITAPKASNSRVRSFSPAGCFEFRRYHRMHELIPPIEGVHPDARPARSDIKAKLLAGVARARGWLDDLIAGRVLDIADLARREKRSVRSTAMLLSPDLNT